MHNERNGRIMKLKRVISLLLSAVIFSAAVPSIADENSNGKSSEYTSLLNYFGIECDAQNGDRKATRAECADMVLKILGIDADSGKDEYDGIFVDVDEDTAYYKSIVKANELGIISGYTSEYFMPEGNISYSQAAKMILVSLNYKKLAESEGGYPNGYVSVADSLGLSKGIGNYEALTLNDAYILMYNALNAELLEVSIKSADDISYNYSGKTLLDKNDIYSVKGVMSAVGDYSLYSRNGTVTENQIEIDRICYNTELELSPEFLGKAVKAYIKDDDGDISVVSFAEDEHKNNVYAFSYSDFIGISGNTAEYDNGTKAKRISLDECSVLYNGSYYSELGQAQTDNLFDDFEEMLLIDNDNDGKAEVLNVIDYKYYSVRGGFEDDEYILTDGGEKIELKNDDISYNMYKDDMNFSMSSFADGDIIRVEKTKLAKGRTHYNIWVCSDKVSAKIDSEIKEERESFYILDGEKYPISREYTQWYKNDKEFVKPGIGQTGIFSLSDDGKIVRSKGDSTYETGYLMSVSGDDEAGEFELRFKIFNMNSKAERYSVAEKVKVYTGDKEYYKGKKIKAEELYGLIQNNSALESDAIKYALDDAGKIAVVIYPLDISDKNIGPGETDYPLTVDYNKTNDSSWNQDLYLYFGVLAYKYYVPNTLKTVYAPLNAADKSDEKKYLVKNIEKPSDDVFHNVTLKLFNVDKYYVPEFAVMESDSAANKELTPFTNISVVTGITDGLDGDDMPIKQLECITAGKKMQYIITDDSEKVKDSFEREASKGKTISDLKAGDIVQISANSQNEIEIYRILFVNTKRGDEKFENSDGSLTGFSGLGLCYATVKNIGTKSIVVNMEDYGARPLFLTTNYGAKYYILVENSDKKPKVRTVSLNDLRVGDKILARVRYNEMCEMVIYR